MSRPDLVASKGTLVNRGLPFRLIIHLGSDVHFDELLTPYVLIVLFLNDMSLIFELHVSGKTALVRFASIY